MNIQAALDAPRFNKGRSGCGGNIEDGYPSGISVENHVVNINPRYSLVMGRGNAVMHDNRLGVNFGASDPRADGQAGPGTASFLVAVEIRNRSSFKRCS